MDKKTEENVLTLFEEYPRTLWGTICEGEYDVLWRIVAQDEIEVEKAAAIMTARFGEKIVEKTIATTIYQTYLSWNKALESERHPELPLEKIVNVEKPDKTDMKILSLLYQNARTTTVELASKVELTPDAVQYRIKKLIEKEYILGYTAWFDARKLGFNYYKLLINFRSITPEKEKQFLQFCIENDDLIFLNKTMEATILN